VSNRLVALVVLAVALTTVIGGLALRRAAAPESSVVAPEGDGALFGVHLDVGQDPLDAYAGRLGRTPAVVGVFVRFPLRERDRAAMDDTAGQALEAGAAVMVTLEPHDGLAAVDDEALDRLTGWLTYWNDEGLPVLVRYAHEMNGSWYPWGQQPEDYVSSFRRVADAVRAAPESEIVWAPNEGTGYPFTDRPDADAADAGVAGGNPPPDPYAPYYPGDEYVDWVGLTLYHFGEAPPWERNERPEEGKLVARIRGTDEGADGEATVPDFHAEYVIGRGKPFVLAETSALFVPGGPGDATEVEIKSAWAAQVFAASASGELPGLDLVMWFEYAKEEAAVPGVVSDWTVTRDPEVRDGFLSVLPSGIQFAPMIPPAERPVGDL
jgi:hypothetical protein